jgi:hypothetical protein
VKCSQQDGLEFAMLQKLEQIYKRSARLYGLIPQDLICKKVCCLAKGYALKVVTVTVTVTVTYCATRLLID